MEPVIINELFTRADWTYTTNIYEVNIRQYTYEGTFGAFSKELPRLKDMGIEVLWLMPVTPISVQKRQGTLGSYYACSDYTSVNPEFGTLEDLKNLVKAAHGLGMKLIIDWVANHTGWDHHWTVSHPEYYRKDAEGNFFDPHGWADVIDLNYDNKDLWKAMIDAMRFWVRECDIDGFRCDMAMLVTLDFWKQARTELDSQKKLFWLAECEEINYHEVFDATYAWKLLHRMEAYWRKETAIAGMDEILQYYDKMFPPGALRALFTTNHDENSHSGSEFERMGDAALPFAVLCATWNGIPLIYSGQELPNKKRLKFFDKDQIDWTGHNEFHHFFQTLLSLRKRNKALRAGDPAVSVKRIVTTADDKVLGFGRMNHNSKVAVFLNLSQDEVSLVIHDDWMSEPFTNVFSGTPADFTVHKSLNLAPWQYLVFEKE